MPIRGADAMDFTARPPDSHQGHERHGRNDGHDHFHLVTPNADKRYLTVALVLLFVFMAGEAAVGVIASSLALIADAGHMLTDAFAIVMALTAMHLSQKPPIGKFTFGLKRAEIFSAQINGIMLVGMAGWFLVEAIRHLAAPSHVEGLLVTWAALAGVAMNLLATWFLGKANRESLNIEGSFQHLATDLYAFIATAAAGALIHWTGQYRLDAVAAILISALMINTGVRLLTRSGRIFLEAAPDGLDPEIIGRAMASDEGVQEVHDLHVWEVTSGFPALSAHVLVKNRGRCHGECHAVRQRLELLLERRFHIHHTTLQVEHCHPEYRVQATEVGRLSSYAGTPPENHRPS